MQNTTKGVADQSMTFQHIEQIKVWFEKAVPQPDSKNIHTQLSVHFEEIKEMVEVLMDAGKDHHTREQLGFAIDVLDFLQRRMREFPEGAQISYQDLDRVSLLDALCDQIVTAVGVAHMLDLDIVSGLAEVSKSNDSKFDMNGNPIFSDERKIIKGEQYFAPDLAPYV